MNHKPGSVAKTSDFDVGISSRKFQDPGSRGNPSPAAICLGKPSPVFSGQSTRDAGRAVRCGKIPRRHLFDFAPDEACRSRPHTQCGRVVPAPLPPPRRALTPPFHPYPPAMRPGGILSVALAVLSVSSRAFLPPATNRPVPGVTRHHALRSPDFPPGRNSFADTAERRSGSSGKR